ncbi:hypothetical protein [Pantoea sp. 1.19]|uniref:hypothetical protein n=1 Tax=Pantoea sp. 1.19 TaxID=1925589 RepID=UPI000948E7AD|nr:hypothetical protein [Pantoea sp. 1.19]
MIRLICLLLGASVLRRRWKLLAALGGVCLLFSVAIFIDIANDGLLSVPLDTLAVLLVLDGCVEIGIAILVGHRVWLPGIGKGIALFLLAFLLWDVMWDNNIVASLLFGLAFLGDGLFRLASALVLRGVGWRRGMALGALECLLSALVFSNWPFHHHITVPLCFSLLLLLSGLHIVQMARQVWRLPTNASVTTLPLFRHRSLRPWREVSYLHPDFPTTPPPAPLEMVVWTPAGAYQLRERRPLIGRYIAAVDKNGAIATGHAALSMPPQLYISHYPLDDFDRSSVDFRATLNASTANDVAGRFLSDFATEVAGWCAPDRRVSFRHYNAAALRNYWQVYASDTTYNLTSRNCSTTVIHALDVALEGVLAGRRFAVFTLLANPSFWLLCVLRGRAEAMTWTPGLALDYAVLLERVIGVDWRLAWYRRFRTAWRERRRVIRQIDAMIAEAEGRRGESR